MNAEALSLFLIEAPQVEPAELKAAVRWRIKDLINFPVDDAVLDVFHIPGQQERGRHKSRTPSHTASRGTRAGRRAAGKAPPPAPVASIAPPATASGSPPTSQSGLRDTAHLEPRTAGAARLCGSHR